VQHAVTLEPTFRERTTLTRSDRVVLRAIAEAMFSEDGDATASKLDAHVEEVDAYISAASKTLRFGMRVALFVIRLAPILLFVRMTTIERLEVHARAAVLARLERSRMASLTLAFVGWRTVMTLLFYEDPAELAAIGYSDARERHRKLPIAPAPEESGVRLKGDAPSTREEVA
jgi:hypothetical protein